DERRAMRAQERARQELLEAGEGGGEEDEIAEAEQDRRRGKELQRRGAPCRVAAHRRRRALTGGEARALPPDDEEEAVAEEPQDGQCRAPAEKSGEGQDRRRRRRPAEIAAELMDAIGAGEPILAHRGAEDRIVGGVEDAVADAGEDDER